MDLAVPKQDSAWSERSGPGGEGCRKGVGSFSERTTPAELRRLGVSWYYNWRPVPRLREVAGVEFVPMFWSWVDVTAANLEAVGRSRATHVLGFNEPDQAGQAAMSVGQCLEVWPRLMVLGQRLGSPAPATASWLEEFMPAARRRGLRVDFVCLHRYPDFSDPKAVDEVGAMLEEAHGKYGLPVWLTECGAADVTAWKRAQVARPTRGMARGFLEGLLAMLDRLAFVERYAWFADRVGDEYAWGTLFEPRRSRLTAMGALYRDAGAAGGAAGLG